MDLKKIANSLYKQFVPNSKSNVPKEMYDVVEKQYDIWLQIPEQVRPKDFEWYLSILLTNEPLSKKIILQCLSWGLTVSHALLLMKNLLEMILKVIFILQMKTIIP